MGACDLGMPCGCRGAVFRVDHRYLASFRIGGNACIVSPAVHIVCWQATIVPENDAVLDNFIGIAVFRVATIRTIVGIRQLLARHRTDIPGIALVDIVVVEAE